MKIWQSFTVDELPADEVECEAYIRITSFGSSPSWYDPGDPPEYEIESVYYRGEEIPVHLPARWRDRFEAWFNAAPIRKRMNPEWIRLAEACDQSMDRFDWGDAQRAADDSNYDGYWPPQALDCECALQKEQLVSQTLFRVHFADGQHVDVHAESPDEARKGARGKRPGEIITKVKIWKGELPC